MYTSVNCSKYRTQKFLCLARPWLVHARLDLLFTPIIATAMLLAPELRPDTHVLRQFPGQAQYLVDATVSAFEHNVQNTGGGLSFGGISVGGKKDEAYLAVDLRIIDSTTGEIAYNRTVEARSGGMGISLGVFKGGFGGNLANESKTPAGKAIRAVIVEISDYLECAMVDQGSCMDEYDAKEEKRKESLKSGISLD